MAGDRSLLAQLKVVEKGYPFYGNVELKSGRLLATALSRGSIVVEQPLLDRLGIGVGDRLHIGSTILTIADVVLHEPDRPVSIYSLGPRVFVSSEDLDALDLVKKGSRIEYNTLLKVRREKELDRIAADLQALALKEGERVETFRTAESGVKRFFDNFLFFLNLIGFFTLMLAGIGIQTALASFLKEKEQTVAIMKSVGATSRFVALQYVMVLSILGLIGTFIGVSLGFVLQNYLPFLFEGLLPHTRGAAVSWRTVLEGILLGGFVVVLFTFLPLHRLRELRPGAIFRKEESRAKKGTPYYAAVFAAFLFFAGVAFWRLKDVKIGLWFIAGVVLLILVTALVTQIALVFLKKSRPRSLLLRQALRGLFRPRNATRPIIITLAASLSVIFSMTLLEQNLDATFVKSYPPDAPNVFFLDIQPAQLEEFSKELGMKTEYYPVVRARIGSVNGEPIDRQKERKRKGDNLGREFSLTYRDYLIEDESVIKGGSLFRSDWGEAQVSVLDTVMEMRGMQIGDRIVFKIQGVPLEARISSVRTRSKQFIQPFFYFVFPEKTLKDAPQTIFTAVNIQKERIADLQNKIVSRFPNVTVIDVTETVSTFSKVMHKLSGITRFFTLFSVIAGVLLIISSVLATRFARIQEAVYYKILGARSEFVLRVFTLENIFLGLISGCLGILISQAGSWIISRKVFDIPYSAFPGLSLMMVLGTVGLVAVVGLLSSLSILRQRPVIFLREQAED
jgi:putative ABC transport system permease protein